MFDSDGFITNSSTQEIVLLEPGISLNVTTTLGSRPIAVSGHINLSNGTNVTNNVIHVYVDGSEQNLSGDFIDTSDTDFNLSYNMTNVSVEGTGDGANVTLNKTVATLVFTASAVDGTSQTAYTFSSVAIGTAGSNRRVVVGARWSY